MLTFGLQLGPQVDGLVPRLVGVREVAGVPGRCADRRNVRPGVQEAARGRLLRLQLSRDGSLSICLCQALNVPSIPTSQCRQVRYMTLWNDRCRQDHLSVSNFTSLRAQSIGMRSCRAVQATQRNLVKSKNMEAETSILPNLLPGHFQLRL